MRHTRCTCHTRQRKGRFARLEVRKTLQGVCIKRPAQRLERLSGLERRLRLGSGLCPAAAGQALRFQLPSSESFPVGSEFRVPSRRPGGFDGLLEGGANCKSLEFSVRAPGLEILVDEATESRLGAESTLGHANWHMGARPARMRVRRCAGAFGEVPASQGSCGCLDGALHVVLP